MTTTKLGDLLGELSAGWRPRGVHEYETDGASRDPSCRVCGQDYEDPRHNLERAQCAKELDAALAQLQPVMEKLVEATENMVRHIEEEHPEKDELWFGCQSAKNQLSAALAEYRKVLHE